MSRESRNRRSPNGSGGRSRKAEHKMDMRKTGIAFDVSFKIDDQTFKAHKFPLAAISPFFQTMFGGDFKEINESEVEIKNVDKATFQLMLDFIYTDKITINRKNAEALIKAADYFQLTNLKTDVSDFLENHVDIENALDIKRLAEVYSIERLRDRVFVFILSNIDEISVSDKFLSLSFDEIEEIMRFKRHISRQETRCHAIMRWLKHDVAREDHVYDLLQLIKVREIDNEFIRHHLFNEDMVKQSNQCLIFLVDEMLSLSDAEQDWRPDVWGTDDWELPGEWNENNMRQRRLRTVNENRRAQMGRFQQNARDGLRAHGFGFEQWEPPHDGVDLIYQADDWPE